MMDRLDIAQAIERAIRRIFPDIGVEERPQVAAARRAFAAKVAASGDCRPLRRVSLRADASWRPTYVRRGLRP